MKDESESSSSQNVTACADKTRPVPERLCFQVSASFRLPVLRSLSDTGFSAGTLDALAFPPPPHPRWHEKGLSG